MKVTFLLTLDLEAEDLTALDSTSEDIIDELGNSYVVLDCKPWSRPSLEPLKNPSSISEFLSKTPL